MSEQLSAGNSGGLIMLGNLPSDFREILTREFVPYSVAIGVLRNGEASEFKPLGTGTLIEKSGRFGILTAHHCLHSFRPEVSVGRDGKDTIMLIFAGRNWMMIPPDELFEHVLTSPVNQEYGPDLTFLQIRPGSCLSSIRAKASFWPMEQDVDRLYEKYSDVATILAAIGYPELRCTTEIKGEEIHRLVQHDTMLNVIEPEGISEIDGWDYILTRCDYSDGNPLVSSFRGVSGGGIWALSAGLQKSTGEMQILDSALVGVSFYQTDLEDETRFIRGHFIKSIYREAWRDFS